MKKIILLSILSAFFVFQCTNEIPTAIYSEDVNLGRVSLIINKEDVPADVVIVEALLSRENHDTLYGNLNLISSTSADILIEDIPAGEWHLKVDAKDSSGVVLYSGETNINIHAGVLTQVNLTLIPTGQGTGSVYIVVNWGVPLVWTDFQFNPIISQSFVPYNRSEEHTSELQSRPHLVCRLLLEKKNLISLTGVSLRLIMFCVVSAASLLRLAV